MEKIKNIRQHCPEVENLMDGKMPFVTRWGIVFVVIIILSFITIFSLSEGTSQHLMDDMIKHTIEQIKVQLYRL